LWQFATDVVDSGGKFSPNIVDTGGRFAPGIYNTSSTRWQNLLPESLIPVVHLALQISLRIYEKKSK
jgi:hypothetical protein